MRQKLEYAGVEFDLMLFELSNTYFFICLVCLGFQCKQSVEDLEDYPDDFQLALKSSYQFKISSVDLAKLKTIRKKKIDRKRIHLFEQMGIPIQIDDKSSKKRIVISNRTKSSNIPGTANVSNLGKRALITQVSFV